MRRRLPIRARIAVTYAALFLAAGAALLAITYGLVANSLGAGISRPSSGPDPKLLAYCKSVTGTGNAPKGSTLGLKCKEAFAAGASAGASDQREQTLHHLLVFSLLGLGVMTVGSGALGWFLAGRILEPVRAVTAAARRLSVENLDDRLSLQGPDDELKHLADTFDAMLGRLDAAFASQRRFVGSASHELRTPLTIMRTELEVTLDRPESTPEELRRMGQIVREAVVRAEQLVDSLLALATSDAGLQHPEEVDLTSMVAASLERTRPRAMERGINVRSELAPTAVVGDAELLQRLADNVVDNAILHNHDGGWVHVGLATSSGLARLVVSNSGAEITDHEAATMFEPFRRIRSDRVRSQRGVGLGLSIVRSIATAHHGTSTAAPIPGGGLQLALELPVHPHELGVDIPSASPPPAEPQKEPEPDTQDVAVHPQP